MNPRKTFPSVNAKSLYALFWKASICCSGVRCSNIGKLVSYSSWKSLYISVEEVG